MMRGPILFMRNDTLTAMQKVDYVDNSGEIDRKFLKFHHASFRTYQMRSNALVDLLRFFWTSNTSPWLRSWLHNARILAIRFLSWFMVCIEHFTKWVAFIPLLLGLLRTLHGFY